LNDTNNLSRVIITDGAGEYLYDNLSDASGATALINRDALVSALKGRDIFYCSYKSGETISFCYVPVSYYDKYVACVVIYDTELEQSAMISILERYILTISAVLEVVVVLMALILARIFSAKANKIMDSISHTRNEDYDYKIKLSGNDEFALVAAEFNQLTDKLRESEAVRRRFVSDASHELKTPLASIKLLSETILQNQLDRETELEFVNDICSEAERLNRMSQKLLLLSRMDSVDETEKEVVFPEAILEKVFRMLIPLAQARGITLIKDITGAPSILATEDDVYQIIFNLVENAIKYNSENGQVTVTIRCDAENVLINVIDTGVGIPEEARKHIFERFYRVDKARSRAAGGAGLGLSIVHDIVEANFGTITVSENNPSGSVFSLVFPYFGVETDDITNTEAYNGNND